MPRMTTPRISRGQKIGLAGTALLGLGVAGGAGAVSLTRPAVEMAPTVPTAIARLPQSSGVVTVKGRVAEVYGNRFVVQDNSGRTLVDAGREGQGAVSVGNPVLVQGRYDQGQLHARFLVDRAGAVREVGAPPPPPPPPAPHGPGAGAPPPPGAGAPPPPGAGAPPPPPPGAGAPPPPPAGAGAPPPPPIASAAGVQAPPAGAAMNRAAPPPAVAAPQR